MDWGAFWAVLVAVFIVIPLVMIWFFAIADLFTRPDLSGLAKCIWLLGIIFLPVLGTFLYFIAKPAYPMPRGASPQDVAETLNELKSLHDSGALNDAQYEEQRQRLMMAT